MRLNQAKQSRIEFETWEYILPAMQEIAKVSAKGFAKYGAENWTRIETKDNIAFAKKFIQDSLVKEKVIQNDGWKEIDSWSDEFSVDAQHPRVEVDIEEK